MTKPMKIMVLFLIIVFGGLVAFNLFRAFMIKRFFASFEPPPAIISATFAKNQVWDPVINSTGLIKSVNGVAISTEQAGIITDILFQSGQLVKKGQLLIRIDDSVERARLQDNQAALKLAQLNFIRQNDLLEKRATPKSSADEAQSKLTQAQASVAGTQAVIAQKNIIAPFDGKIGIRNINIGQYVSPGTEMVSLQSLNPLYLNFSLPEQYLKDIYINQLVTLKVDVYPNTVFAAQITAVDAEVDAKTHNILVQATVPNPNFKLYPGLFAMLQIHQPQKRNVITVPQTAVTSSLYGDTVFVIENKGKDKNDKPILKVYQRFVETGDQRGDEIEIVRGLKANEEVVTSGQLKLSDDMRVDINNDVKMVPTLQNNY